MLIWPNAACRDTDPQIFYPAQVLPDDATPFRICRRCPVREACLEYALAHNEKHGIWGGESERARERIRRRRRRQGVTKVT